MTLKGAQQKLKENKEDTVNNADVVAKLQNIKGLLIELKEII